MAHLTRRKNRWTSTPGTTARSLAYSAGSASTAMGTAVTLNCRAGL